MFPLFLFGFSIRSLLFCGCLVESSHITIAILIERNGSVPHQDSCMLILACEKFRPYNSARIGL